MANEDDILQGVDPARVAAGASSVEAGGYVAMVGPNGWRGLVPVAEVPEAEAKGFRPETGEEHQERQLEQKYGDSPIRAGLEGGARGLTFGLSDAAIGLYGDKGDVEGVRERKRLNAGPAIGGEIAGALGPALFTGGATAGRAVGIGEQLLASTPAGLTTRAGRGVASAVEGSGLVRGLAEGGTLSRATGRALPKLAQGGAEGALFGAGQGVSNLALSENPLSAEAIMAEIGLNGLYGTGFGLAGGTLGAAVHEAGRVTRKIGTAAVESMDAASASARVLRAEGGAATKVEAAGDDIVALRRAREAEVTQIEQARVVAAKEAAADATLYRQEMRQFKADIYGDLPATKGGQRGAIIRAERALTRVTKAPTSLAESPARAVDAVDEFGGVLREIDGVVPSPAVKAAIQRTDDLLLKLRATKAPIASPKLTEIDDQIALLALPKPQTLEAQLFGMAKDKAAGAIVGGAVGMLFGHGALGGAVGGILQGFAKQAMKGKLAGSVFKSAGEIGDGVSRALGVATGEAGTAAMAAAEPAMRVFTGTSTALNSEEIEARPHEDEATTAYRQHAALAQQAATNPVAMRQRLHDNLAGVRAIDDALAGQLEELALRRLSYVASIIPPPPPMGTPGDQFSRYSPPRSVVGMVADVVAVLERPARLLEDLAAGRLAPHKVEAVKNVYPAYFERIQKTIVERLAELRKTMTYAKRVQISILFGVPADSTMRPDYVRQVQARYAADRVKQEEEKTKGPSALKKQDPTQVQRISSPQ